LFELTKSTTDSAITYLWSSMLDQPFLLSYMALQYQLTHALQSITL
jgi:hypothetical protein